MKDNDLSRKEIAAIIRRRLAAEVPECKFSVTMQPGHDITIACMSGPFEPFQADTSVLGDKMLSKSAQLNYYQLLREPSDDSIGNKRWTHLNNGISLTSECWDVMAKVARIGIEHHWDESDMQFDYHNCNFYLSLDIGKWDKPYINTSARS